MVYFFREKIETFGGKNGGRFSYTKIHEKTIVFPTRQISIKRPA